MGIVINTNLSSLVAQRSLTSSTAKVNSSLEKLSTGKRINHVADDAAGYSISQRFQSQYRGADVAKANAQDGINMLQTAEGDLSTIQDNLQRVRDLTVQASSDTLGSAERQAIQYEIETRLEEVDRLAEGSSFNGKKLLNGENEDGLSIQIGANSDADTNRLTMDVFDSAKSDALGITTDVSSAMGSSESASSFLDEIDTAISNVSDRQTKIGSMQNRLESSIQSLSITSENLKAADSRIMDVDIAEEAANLTKNQILQQASISILAQANQAPSMALNLL